jgi:catechol 2,3-dioxygenase-like lactoylglutathione lyase family enzyme
MLGASLVREMTDLGFTHVALDVADVDATAAFYTRFAGMRVVHRRSGDVAAGHSAAVIWLSDLTRPFVIVCIQTTEVKHPLAGLQHLGVACARRDEVDTHCAAARADGFAVSGPHDAGPPVGYWAIITDPDGHNLELSHGQSVEFTVDEAGRTLP